jgi:glycosyltransferase involved in cell wall biosynthesis
MPVYNAEKYVREAIESILRQTYSNFEFIIIDDCSNDKTYDVIKKYALRDSRIILYRNEKNLGISGNRNKAISLSKAEYIVWQDADDISVPNRIEEQLTFMESHSEVSICGGFLQFFDEKGDIGIREYPTDDETMRKYIFRFSQISQGSSIVRKNCYDKVGFYDLKIPYAEDLDMSFRIGTVYKFANIPKVLLRYRVHHNSATYRKLRKIELNTIAIRKKFSFGYGYKMSVIDKIYNLLQYFSIYIFPTKSRIWLFNLIRNSKYS